MGRSATLRVDIVTNAKGDGVDRTSSKLGKLGGLAKKAGVGVAAGLAVVGTAAVAAGKAAAESASRQQQAYGALNTVYGKSARRVKAWARTAADSVGLARSEYAELSSIVGSQLQNMGMATDKSANKSRQLIKLGADLAATYGGSVSDAVGAVSSLLRGETDPIERYGVSIKQADINARLASQGLDNLTGKAAKQAQAQAVLTLLTQQTTKAQGAFKRESNTLAGAQERLKAKFENVKATVGKALLPILTKLFSWLGDKVLPGALKLGRALAAKLGPAVKTVGKFISTKLVPVAKDLWRIFMTRIYPGIKSALSPVLKGLRSVVSSVTSAVSRNSSIFHKLGNIIATVFRVTQPLRSLLGHSLGIALRVVGHALGFVIDVLGRMVSWVNAAANAVGWLIDKLAWLKNLNPAHILSAVGSLFSTPVTAMVAPVVRGIGPGGVSPALNTAALNLAAAGTAAPLGASSPGTWSPTPYVDARDFSTTIRVDGALDPVAVGRQLEELLERRDRRLGRRRLP